MPVADVHAGNIAKSALYIMSCPEGGEREKLHNTFGERNKLLTENFDQLLETFTKRAESPTCPQRWTAKQTATFRDAVYLITGAVVVAVVSAERREVAKLQAELEHLVAENLRLRGELKKRL